MNMEALQKWNPELPIYSVHDAKFAEYGRVITGLPTDELLAAAKKIEAPAEGSKYEASVPALEQTDFAKPMQDALFGELPAQVGYCWGHNTTMNAMEWHTSSEINVAVTPLVLILGRRADLVHNRIDSSAFCAGQRVCARQSVRSVGRAAGRSAGCDSTQPALVAALRSKSDGWSIRKR